MVIQEVSFLLLTLWDSDFDSKGLCRLSHFNEYLCEWLNLTNFTALNLIQHSLTCGLVLGVSGANHELGVTVGRVPVDAIRLQRLGNNIVAKDLEEKSEVVERMMCFLWL